MGKIDEITAVILAGGFGTRLRSVVPDKPKVLADVCGRPFLSFLLDQLADAGFENVVISTGYMAQAIEDCFANAYGPLHIEYSREDRPLGTGGAVRLALEHLRCDIVLVMNGDSFVNADLADYVTWFFERQRRGAMLLTKVSDTRRFGSVDFDENKTIVSFREKGTISGPGWINAGVYLLKTALLAGFEPGRTWSIEREFFPRLAGKELFGYCVDGEFLDIGTPESYAAAEDFFTRQARRLER